MLINLTNNTTVKFTDDVISNGATTIGGNSTLQIATDYIADSIQANAAGDTGTLQFVNTKDILVTLKGNPNPDDALAALQVSGSADVATDGIVNVNGEIGKSMSVFGEGVTKKRIFYSQADRKCLSPPPLRSAFSGIFLVC